MTASPANHLITAEELLALPERPGVSYELVRGELRCAALAVALAGVAAARAGARIGGFVERHSLGVCGTAASGFKLASNLDTVRAPGLLDILDPVSDRLLAIVGEGYEPKFSCGCFPNDFNRGTELTAATLSRMGALGATLWLDIYC